MRSIFQDGLNIIDVKGIPGRIGFDQQMGKVIFYENFRHTLVVEDTTGFRIELGQGVVDERKFGTKLCKKFIGNLFKTNHFL